MPDAAVLEQPPLNPNELPYATVEAPLISRRKGTFSGDRARLAAIASAKARKLKGILRSNPDFAASQPLTEDQRTLTGLVVATLTREETALTRIGDEARLHLGRALLSQVKVLAEQVPAKISGLTGRDGSAQASKTLVDACSGTFGWGEGTVPGIIVMGEVERTRPEEVQAKVTDCQPAAPGPGEPGGVALEVQPIGDTTSEQPAKASLVCATP